MKLVLTLLGVVLLVVAAVYFLMPADQLPGFFPGHLAGDTHVHTKHGIVAGVVGPGAARRRRFRWPAVRR